MDTMDESIHNDSELVIKNQNGKIINEDKRSLENNRRTCHRL